MTLGSRRKATDIRKVLMTADTFGGVFTYAVTLASELAKRGVAVHLATMGALLRPEQRELVRGVPNLVVHQTRREEVQPCA